MAKAGFDAWTICLLSRHSSTAVFGYIRDAPLTSTRLLAGRAAAGWARPGHALPAASGERAAPELLADRGTNPKRPRLVGGYEVDGDFGASTNGDALANTNAKVDALTEAVTELAAVLANQENIPPPTVTEAEQVTVVNLTTLKAHLSRCEVFDAKRQEGRTACGWRFGLREVSILRGAGGQGGSKRARCASISPSWGAR